MGRGLCPSLSRASGGDRREPTRGSGAVGAVSGRGASASRPYGTGRERSNGAAPVFPAAWLRLACSERSEDHARRQAFRGMRWRPTGGIASPEKRPRKDENTTPAKAAKRKPRCRGRRAQATAASGDGEATANAVRRARRYSSALSAFSPPQNISPRAQRGARRAPPTSAKRPTRLSILPKKIIYIMTK